MPRYIFRQCIARYRGEPQVTGFTYRAQFLCLAFAHPTFRESLRDADACLRAQRQKLYHLGTLAISVIMNSESERCDTGRLALFRILSLCDIWLFFSSILLSIVPYGRYGSDDPYWTQPRWNR